MATELANFSFNPLVVADQSVIQELTQEMTAGLGGEFKRTARLSLSNSGDFALIDENGEEIDLGREVNFVIVAQRESVSRMHYGQSYDEMKASGERIPPDCYSTDGVSPDSDVEKPYSDKCKTCEAEQINGQKCSYYRRMVVVIAYEDGTFSDPVVFEPKAKALFDKDVVQGRYGSLQWYMAGLKNNTVNGKNVPVPVQTVVTRCIPKPKEAVATGKFGIAPNDAGGYWTLTAEQFGEIMELKNSDEVKEMLEPFHAAHNNPSMVGDIPVTQVAHTPKPKAEEEPKAEVKEEPKAKPAPAKKAPAPKKPAPAKKVEAVVLGINHPDVVNSADFDYEEIKEWANEASEEEVREFLEENFPQALKPVEQEVKEAQAKKSPAKKAPAKKAEPVAEPQPEPEAEPVADDNVVSTDGSEISSEDRAKAEQMAEQMDEWDD